MEFFINKNINIYADQLCIFLYIIIIILFVDFCTIIPLNIVYYIYGITTRSSL